MALFIADLSFDDALSNAAKLGIFSASVVSAGAGLAVLACSTRGKSVSLDCAAASCLGASSSTSRQGA